jgi:hypothetical protein
MRLMSSQLNEFHLEYPSLPDKECLRVGGRPSLKPRFATPPALLPPTLIPPAAGARGKAGRALMRGTLTKDSDGCMFLVCDRMSMGFSLGLLADVVNNGHADCRHNKDRVAARAMYGQRRRGQKGKAAAATACSAVLGSW